MVDLPPYPRKNRYGSYAVGPGIYWWKVWKEEYHDEGGVLGYATWLDMNKMIDREKRKEKR